MPKSCSTCPSNLNPSQASVYFGRSVGTPMCARYGTPLANPRLIEPEETSRIQELIGERCAEHGKFKPTAPVNFDGLQVATPDVAHMWDDTEVPAEHFTRASCTACTMCKHYVKETVVEDQIGFTAGLCKAKGRLILTNKTREMASGCDRREVGPNGSNNTDGNILYPVYDSGGFAPLVVNPVDEFLAPVVEKSTLPHDSQTYPTDRPVSPDEAAEGIRAWMRVPDPENSRRSTYLPLFRRDFFSPEEQAKIPMSGDDEHPEMYVDHAGLLYTITCLWLELDETPALWGEAGTGKTELGRHMAWLMGMPFERISITSSTEIDEIAGKTGYDPERGTYFQLGRLPLAWMKPCVFVIDEPNTALPEVWQFMRPLFDNSKQLIMDLDRGQKCERATYCFPMLAMNPAWDIKNKGVEEIADADASRLMHIFMTLPTEEVERNIISARVRLDGWEITESQLSFIMKIAREVRKLSKDGTIPISWGIRPQIQVARALRWFAPVTAYKRAIADFMEPEAANALLDVVRAHA